MKQQFLEAGRSSIPTVSARSKNRFVVHTPEILASIPTLYYRRRSPSCGTGPSP
jgi:hypothetical protein